MDDGNEINLETGFVFLDENNRPFLVRHWGDDTWLYYWTKTEWVSLRKVSQMDVWTFPRNLTPEQQSLYLKGIK